MELAFCIYYLKLLIANMILTAVRLGYTFVDRIYIKKGTSQIVLCGRMRWMLHGNPKCEIHIIAMTWLTTTLTHEQIKLEYYRKAICTNDGAVDKVRSRSLTWTRYIHASHIDQHGGAFWFPGTSIINHLVNNHFHCYLQTLFVLYFPFDDI